MCLQTNLLAQDQNRSRKIYSSCFHFRQVWRHLIRLLRLTIQAINIRFWIVGSGHTFFFSFSSFSFKLGIYWSCFGVTVSSSVHLFQKMFFILCWRFSTVVSIFIILNCIIWKEKNQNENEFFKFFVIESVKGPTLLLFVIDFMTLLRTALLNHESSILCDIK